MELLKSRILSDGTRIGTEIIKVDSFLNHQIDVKLIDEIGKEIANRFDSADITKILTIEASGIAIACITSIYFDYIPVVFAKKSTSRTMTDEYYCSNVKSFTKSITSEVRVSKKFIDKNDKILIIDDFLAHGEAATGLADIVRQAGASVAGVAVAIEKEYQGGGEKVRNLGIRLESLAVVTCIKEGKIYFK